MAHNTEQPDIEEVWPILEQIDPVNALIDQLSTGIPVGQAVIPWLDLNPDLVPANEAGKDREPASMALARMHAIAAWSAFVARQLLGQSVVTASVLGSGPGAQHLLCMIAQYVPGISHVTFYTDGGVSEVEPSVIDRLDLAGISFMVARSAAEAVRGANLVIAYGDTAPGLRIEELSPRSVLVHAGGEDLPDELVDGVGRIYVDDISLLDANQHRYFVRAHLAGAIPDHRRSHGLIGVRHGDTDMLGDFRQLLEDRGRPNHLDRVVLVELLDSYVSDRSPTPQLQPACQGNGFGTTAGYSAEDNADRLPG